MWPFKKKQDWKLVKTISIDITVGRGDFKREGIQYFYLYEDPEGNRKMEQKCTIRDASDDLRGIAYYQEIIYPWLKGDDHPDIPSYWDKVQDNNKKYVQEMYCRLLRK